MSVSDEEVAAKRANVDALRQQLREGGAAAADANRAGENDLKAAALDHEAEMLQAQLARLTGAPAPEAPAEVEAEAPVEEPVPDAVPPTPTEAAKGRRGGLADTNGQEG